MVRFKSLKSAVFITNDKTEELRSILECKKECNFIWFIESRAVIYNTPKVFERESPSDLIQNSTFSEITAFVVFANEKVFII
ncbi:hypothetical protein HPMKM5_0705 [Helicobacter pylori]|nr:hypothetical protein HPMKM5_0705 [Helicobacter pylori]